MKKIILAAAAVLTSALLFASCGKSDAVKNTEELIGNIGKKITLDSGSAIEAAKNAYDALSEEDRQDVGNFRKLEKASAEYDSIISFNNDWQAILDAADPQYSKGDANMTELLARYEEMKEEYKKMSSARKEMLPGDLTGLDAAVEKLASYADTAANAAAAYVRAFTELNKDKGYTVEKIGCIKQVRNETEYHFFALSYKDKKGEEHSVYSTARYSGTEVAPILANPDVFFAKAPVSEDYNALTNGNTDIDTAAVLTAAEKLEVSAQKAGEKKDNKKDGEKKEQKAGKETAKAD